MGAQILLPTTAAGSDVARSGGRQFSQSKRIGACRPQIQSYSACFCDTHGISVHHTFPSFKVFRLLQDGRTDGEIAHGYRRNPTWAELQLNPSVSSMTFTSSKPTTGSDTGRLSLDVPDGVSDDQGRSPSALTVKPKVAFNVDSSGASTET